MNITRILTAALLLCVIQAKVQGFNFRNHQITGVLAYEQLPDPIKAKLLAHFKVTKVIQPVFGGNGEIDVGLTLGRLCYWADEERGRERQRRGRISTSPHHYVNIHIDFESGYNDKLSDPNDPNKGGLILVMDQHLAVLTDTKARPEEFDRSLAFLVHFIGDCHQPLHLGHRGDRGGNDVEVTLPRYRRPTNLHALWDGGITDYVYRSSAQARSIALDDSLLKEVRACITQENLKSWRLLPDGGLKPAFRLWANESFNLAKHEVYYWPLMPGQKPEDRRLILSGMRLPPEYVDAKAKVIIEQLAKASSRLALVLETVFKDR